MEDLPFTGFSLALHLGEVMYGNIGAPERLVFTVIGPAVNTVSRIESLCGELDRSLLVSEDFFEHCQEELESLGEYHGKGFAAALRVFGSRF